MSTEPRPKKLLDQVRDEIKRKHYSPRTEESCANWIKRFIIRARFVDGLPGVGVDLPCTCG